MTKASVDCFCPAKINLHLAVGRADANGMHPIVSTMASLTFGDQLSISYDESEVESAASALSQRIVRRCADDAPRKIQIDWPVEQDLIARAWRGVETHVGRRLPVRITLRKRIPTGAGLGGGSANAAAVIHGLDYLFGLSLDATDHRQLAAELGSDVHFALGVGRGETAALVTGLGEKLRPLALPPRRVLLLLPDFGCATAPVYRAFDQLGLGREPAELAALAKLLRCGAETEPAFNDLESAACRAEPRLTNFLAAARQRLRLPVHVTGSGSTCYVLPANEAELAEAVAQTRGWEEAVTVAAGLRSSSPITENAVD